MKRIVVPSRGMARELAAEYPRLSGKVQILPNPVESARMRPPAGFDRESLRAELGIAPAELAVVFVSLGHFERKGLPQLLEALALVPLLKLVVVGGRPGLISAYRRRAEKMGLGGRVRFVGMQCDVRPYLWCADLFAFPSFYEAFPLVALEAAAAGLPLLVTPMNGVEEFLAEGGNGFLVAHTPEDIARGLERFLELSPAQRRAMGAAAQRSVECYSAERFVSAWREIYGASPSA